MAISVGYLADYIRSKKILTTGQTRKLFQSIGTHDNIGRKWKRRYHTVLVWAYKTSLTLPLFIEMLVPSQNNG
jgi:hypothetical protein